MTSICLIFQAPKKKAPPPPPAPFKEEEELVAYVLQRMGWVRKHLVEDGQHVRGIVLVETPPASLNYAAAALSDTVCFKTWRVAIQFQTLDIQ